MKLAAGNPNLVRKNKTTGLGSFASTLGDVMPKKRDRAPSVYAPSARDPGAVPPPSINLMQQPTYMPPRSEYVRPGANDFLAIKSKGSTAPCKSEQQ